MKWPHTPPDNPDRRRSKPPARDGFTLVELMMVVLIISIIAAVAIPNVQNALMRARAAEAVGDLESLRVAVFNYQADNNLWPPDAEVGLVPSGLARYLPEGFSMVKERYELNYDNWTGLQVEFIAVTVEVADTSFGNYLLDMLGPNAWTNGSFKFTWVLEWLD